MMKHLRRLVNRAGFDVVRLRHSNADLSTHLANVFQAAGIDCVLDVGANAGQYGKFLRELGFKGWIVSFEPVHAVFQRLKAEASSDPRWICYNMALGDRKESLEINVYSSSVFSSFLQAADYSKDIWNSLNESKTETVDVERLDDLLPEIIAKTSGRRLYLKMDTQGYDINVFRGAKESLEKVEALQSELALIPVYKGMAPPYDVLSEFHEKGYFISGMYPINREQSLAVIEYDCVLVKRIPNKLSS